MLKGPVPMTFEERKTHFWTFVDIQGPDDCWPWKRGGQNHGYGTFHFPDLVKDHGPCFSAHVVAFILLGGKFKKGKRDVLHSCDNKLCCNGKHLRAGNHSENTFDCYERTRKRKIETRKEVLQIQKEYKQGSTYSAISVKHGVSKSWVEVLVKLKIKSKLWRNLK